MFQAGLGANFVLISFSDLLTLVFRPCPFNRESWSVLYAISSFVPLPSPKFQMIPFTHLHYGANLCLFLSFSIHVSADCSLYCSGLQSPLNRRHIFRSNRPKSKRRVRVLLQELRTTKFWIAKQKLDSSLRCCLQPNWSLIKSKLLCHLNPHLYQFSNQQVC